MTRDAEVVVVGGGVAGLAAAAALARAGRDVLLLERRAGFGQEASSRNSGVIHAGLYYPTGSLKARLCVAGREALAARCERLRRLGTANGAPGLEILDAAAGPGEPFRDFVVAEESAAGLPGLVSCIGIESPGLTAAPAIAERMVDLLR